MITPSSSQIAFFRSIVENALQSDKGTVLLAVENPSRSSILLSVLSSEDENHLDVTRGNSDPIRLSLQEAIESILATLSESGGTLLIERGQDIQRIEIKGGSIIRETVQNQTPILKQPLWAIGKTTHLDPNKAAPLLQAIGLMTPQGEIKAPLRKKFKQVNHFIELLQPFLPQSAQKKPYTIVDCGCGKSYLGFALFWYIRHILKCPARFYGIDIAQDRIDQCRDRAQKLNLKEMQFECASNREAKLPEGIDLLVSLHACDTATDEAIALAVARRARHIASAPCCQHELAGQIESIPHYPLTKHGLFKHRFADLLTDMMRCLFLEAHGYSVTVGEFISVEETPKNLLIRAKQGNRDSAQRLAEYESFKKHYGISPAIDNLILDLQIY